MTTDKYTLETFNAGQTTWFEADKVTLSAIKAKYLMEANKFLYFRKGEDWLKDLIDWIGALGGGEQQILDLAQACGQQVLEFTRSCLKSLLELDVKACLEWYLIISGRHELLKKDLRFVKKKIWPPFVELITKVKRLFGRDFRILCTDSQENRNHLPKWKSRRTKVRFYAEDQQAGSHRFYLNEKGYAVFWRQGKGQNTRFYGFEGNDPKIIKRLKDIFEKEWKGAENAPT